MPRPQQESYHPTFSPLKKQGAQTPAVFAAEAVRKLFPESVIVIVKTVTAHQRELEERRREQEQLRSILQPSVFDDDGPAIPDRRDAERSAGGS